MDAKQLMSVEEVKEFFSETAEFEVSVKGTSIEITYEDDDKVTSVLVSKDHVNIQQLIRKVKQLVWNHCNNILD
jgi:hypothetical protein